MSTIRILLLGLLNDKKPRHGYEIKQELESWNTERWANVSYGSIYFALKKMAEEHLLKSTEELSKDKKPDRTVYEITPLGTEHFLLLLRKQWWEHKPLIDPFQVAFTFAKDLPRDEVISALEYRIDHLKIHIKSMERIISLELQDARQNLRYIAQLQLSVSHTKTELGWMEEVIKKVKQGQLP